MIARQHRALFGIVAASALVLFTASAYRHATFQTQAWDLGIFDQLFWNTVHGRIMQGTIEELPRHFAIHMSPTLLLLTPFYAVFQHPYTLLFLQALALAAGAIPLFFLAERIAGSRRVAYASVGAYLLHPSLHAVALFDFHEIAFFVPAFLYGTYYAFERRPYAATLAFLLAAGTREDAPLIVMLGGVAYMAVMRSRKGVIAGGAAFLGALSYFFIAVLLLMPVFGGGLLRADRYAELGGSAREIVSTVISDPVRVAGVALTRDKLLYGFRLFAPLGFLPFFALWPWLIIVPGLLENMLTNYAPQFAGVYQYDAILLPGLFIGALYGVRRAARVMGEDRAAWMLLGAACAGCLIWSPLFRIGATVDHARASAFSELVRLVPKDVSVAASVNAVPHIAGREQVFVLGHEPEAPGVLLFDGADSFGFRGIEAFQEYMDRYARSGAYDAIRIIDDRFFLVARRDITTRMREP